MIINNNNYSVIEVREMLDRKDLIVNRDYQRASGLWPTGARSYFIDTILNNFPFPKIYFYEYFDRANGKMRKELVDGQQRISTMVDFMADKFAISGESPFKGKRFSDLEPEQQDAFRAYPVSVDVIRNATRAEILQMFRRMNAFTLPLNEAEKRHSSFQGAFKWFVNQILDEISEPLVEFGVFTNRQIVRMADAELVAEIILSLEQGIISSSPKMLNSTYKRYDSEFDDRERYASMIVQAVQFISGNLSELRKTFLMKPYAVHILIVALIHNRWRIPAIAQQFDCEPAGAFAVNVPEAERRLLELALTHEAGDADEENEYVWGAAAGTNRAARRAARFRSVMAALGNPVRGTLDAALAR